MKGYLKSGGKVLFDYVISLVVFSIFSYIFISIAGKQVSTYLPYYCFLIFIFTYLLIYSDMKRLALKEKKPQYDLHPYPLKGLVYGAVGFAPFALIELISIFIRFQDTTTAHLKHVALNILLGPMFFIIRIFSESPLGYILATLIIPIVALLGYLAGYYNINAISRLKKKEEKPVERKFEKSPWNPTNRATGSGVKKKKKKPASQANPAKPANRQ